MANLYMQGVTPCIYRFAEEKRGDIMSMRKFTVYFFIILLCVGGISFAQQVGSVWEGTASMSRYGEFPATGLYAASNSFPRNTLVEVENLHNGKKSTVIVADRLNNPGLFMLLSREAAGILGITEDETVQVRVILATESETLAENLEGEQPFSEDPDVNPAVSAEGYTYELPEEPEIVEEPEEPELVEEPVVEDTPRISFSVSSPERIVPRLPDLALPVEPEIREVSTTETVEEPLPVRETPMLTAMAESPAYFERRLPDLALPSEPELPESEEPETVLPEREVPKLTDVETTPDLPELRLAVVPEPVEPVGPVEPVEEIIKELPIIEEEAPRLTMMTNPSPDVDALDIGDIDIPEEPDKAVVAEEDEVPNITIAMESPYVDDLMITGVPEPIIPVEPEEIVEIVEVVEEPEDLTPEVTELLETPEPVKLVLVDVNEPREPGEVEIELPEVAEAKEETPEPVSEIAMAEVDVPTEPVEVEPDLPEVAEAKEETPITINDIAMVVIDEPTEPAAEEIAETVEIIETTEEPVEPELTEETPEVAELAEAELKVDIPADALLVMEPAEPRPPEDLTPEAVEVPGTDVEEPEAVEEPETEPHHPEPPEEVPEEPLVAEGTETAEVESVEIEVDELQKGAFYVQLGVYSEAVNAKQVADKFGSVYPVAVLQETSASKQVYKVLLGPVNRDESGGLLFNFRSKGFKDAFIREGR